MPLKLMCLFYLVWTVLMYKVVSRKMPLSTPLPSHMMYHFRRVLPDFELS